MLARRGKMGENNKQTLENCLYKNADKNPETPLEVLYLL